MLVYDITNEKTFDSVGKWLEELKYQTDPDIVIYLAGNKTDLATKRQVRKEVAEAFAKQHDLIHIETTSTSNSGVNDVFLNLLETINEKQKSAGKQKPAGAPLEKFEKKENSCNCWLICIFGTLSFMKA